jgi:hypothetical protein
LGYGSASASSTPPLSAIYGRRRRASIRSTMAISHREVAAAVGVAVAATEVSTFAR